MKKYNVTITEVLKRDVVVDADSREEADDIARSEWKIGKHILDSDDFRSVEFHANPIEKERDNAR
jgi:hypothetical protein